ncbi:glycoside hydrolase, partial [Saitoella complicata NRRL Y-17804]
MTKRDTPTGKRAIYYHTNWATYSRNYQVADLPIDYITDIAYAFYNLAQNDTAGGYTIKSGDTWADLENPLIGKGVEPQNTWDSPDVELGNLGQFYKLKENGKDFDLSLSIGGWSWSTYFSDAVSTEASRKTLAASIVQLFESRPVFSGVSIDWEYLSDDAVNYGNTGNHVSTADPVNFMAFLTELRTQLASAGMSDYEISFCVTAAPEKIAFPVAEVVALVDQLHVMTYDFTDGNWGDSISAHQANLFDSPYGKWSVDKAVKAYLNYGVPASKIYIGAPFYSRGFANTDGLGKSASGGSPDMSWETGVMDYKDLPVAGATEYFDEVAQAGYSYDPVRRVFNTYETPRSLLSKCQYVHDQGLGGIIVWESSADAEYTSDRSLMKVLYENL